MVPSAKMLPALLAVAVCLLALSPEAAWIPPGPANGLPAGGMLSQRPAEIPPDAWQRILGRIERDGYAVRPVAEVGAARTREEAILRASDAQVGDEFGIRVAVSGDTAIVGARREDGGPGDPEPGAGAAYVFERNQGGMNTWGEVKKLTASDFQANDFFGQIVAISGDTAIVGAEGEDGGPTDPASTAGAAYVFPTSFFGIFIAGLSEPGRVPLLIPPE